MQHAILDVAMHEMIQGLRRFCRNSVTLTFWKNMSINSAASNPAPNNQNPSVRSIAADVDFKLYLDAVVVSSQRSRAVLYVLMIAMITIYASYRNNVNPDWINHRIEQLQIAYKDKFSGKIPSTNEKIILANKHADGKLAHPSEEAEDVAIPEPSPASNVKSLPISNPTPSVGGLDPLRIRIEALLKQRAEATTLQMPIIGLKFDTNDVGIIGGLILSSVLYVLASCIRREAINLGLATARAKHSNPDNLELLLMAQVLSPAPKLKLGDETKRFRFSNIALYSFMILPIILDFFICLNNLNTWRVRQVLQTPAWRIVDFCSEWGFLLLLVALSIACCIEQTKLNVAFGKLEKEEMEHNKNEVKISSDPSQTANALEKVLSSETPLSS